MRKHIMAKLMNKQIASLVVAVKLILMIVYMLATCETKSEDEKCGHDLSAPTGLKKFIDCKFLRKVLWNMNPFSRANASMKFYLYKKGFPICGPQIQTGGDSLRKSGFNSSHPTRIIIHGWMGQSTDALNRDITNAYLAVGDFNVIVVDWSTTSTTPNYLTAVEMIESFGEIVANFTKYLHKELGIDYDDIYLIGHSLGAQIAGSAGKKIRPAQFNTIFALDPAGPAFRNKAKDCSIDSTDAKYVESIQTSVNLGLLEPVGHATFFPNRGIYQKCIGFGCSHSRAHEFFAESITSARGFWGYLCDKTKRTWHCPFKGLQYKMGGEPSQPKTGTFYVETRASFPYAMGRTHKYIYG